MTAAKRKTEQDGGPPNDADFTADAPTGVPGMAPHHSLVAALAAFQRELPTVPKNATGQVPGKREHKYAKLDDLNGAVLPRLAAFGLSWSCEPTRDDAGRRVLRWVLAHAPTGDYRTGEWELAGGTNWEIGSALTYARRYCLESVTGVAATEDDDGRAAQEAATARREQPRPVVERPPTVSEVRGSLAADAQDSSWDQGVIFALYRNRNDGEELWDATDPVRVEKFRQSLFAIPELVLRGEQDLDEYLEAEADEQVTS